MTQREQSLIDALTTLIVRHFTKRPAAVPCNPYVRQCEHLECPHTARWLVSARKTEKYACDDHAVEMLRSLCEGV